MAQTRTQDDLLTVIIADHRAFEEVFQLLERKDGSPQDRRDLADHMITELVRHSVAEEQFMYPEVRKSLDHGDKVADHEIEEHGEVEELLKQLEGIAATDPKFDSTVQEVILNVRHHMQEEESQTLPRLAQVCSDERLTELGEMVLQAKKIAPTRPHPNAPSTPPANLVLGPGVGLIDRLRDALTKR